MNASRLSKVAALGIALSVLVSTGTNAGASDAINEIRNLYVEFQTFKNDEEFRRAGYPSPRLGPAPGAIRQRNPQAPASSRRGLDQPPGRDHNTTACSVNPDRRCLNVVDRFRMPRHFTRDNNDCGTARRALIGDYIESYPKPCDTLRERPSRSRTLQGIPI